MRLRLRQFSQLTEGAAVSVQAACAERVIKPGYGLKMEVAKNIIATILASRIFKKDLISNHDTNFMAY